MWGESDAGGDTINSDQFVKLWYIHNDERLNLLRSKRAADFSVGYNLSVYWFITGIGIPRVTTSGLLIAGFSERIQGGASNPNIRMAAEISDKKNLTEEIEKESV